MDLREEISNLQGAITHDVGSGRLRLPRPLMSTSEGRGLTVCCPLLSCCTLENCLRRSWAKEFFGVA